MTVVNKSEIAKQIAAAEGLSGAALEERAKKLETLSEKALSEKLQAILNGTAAKTAGIEDDSWNFMGVNVGSAQNSAPSNEILTPLTYEESKDFAVQSLNQNVETGFAIITKSVDNGKIGELYDKWKEKNASFLSLPSTVRALHLQAKSNELLELANNNNLTKAKYYEMLKGTLLEIFPGVETMSEQEKQNLAQKINTLTPEQVKRWQDNILRLPQEGSANFDDAIENFNALFEMETSNETSKIVQNGDGQTLVNETKRTPKSAYEITAGDELMTFEQVFKFERGVEFDKDKIFTHNTKSAQYQLIESSGIRLDTIKNTLFEPLALVKGNNQSAVSPQLAENSNRRLETALYQSLKSLYGDDEAALNKGLQDLSGFEGLVFENGRLKNKLNVKQGSNFSEYAPVPYAQAAENVIKSLESNYEKLLDGKTREQYAEEYAESYVEAYGEANSEKLARAYLKDQQEGVESIRGTVETAGLVIMAGSMLVFPPAAFAGAGISAFGGVGTELYDEMTKNHKDSEKIIGLTKELAVNAALTGIGAGGGAIASKTGLAAKKSLQKTLSPRLASFAGSVADMGTDAAISLAGDLALTGQISLEGEGFSQVMSLVLGHKSKISAFAKKKFHSISPKSANSASNQAAAFKNQMSKYLDASGKQIFTDFEIKQMEKSYNPENLAKIPGIYKKITETNNVELFRTVISNPALIKSQNLGLVEDILDIKADNFSHRELSYLLRNIKEDNISHYETVIDAVKDRGNELDGLYKIKEAVAYMNDESLPALKKALKEQNADGKYLFMMSDIPSFVQKGYIAYQSDKLPEDVKQILTLNAASYEQNVFTAIEIVPKGSKFFDELTQTMRDSSGFNYEKIAKLADDAVEEATLNLTTNKKLKSRISEYNRLTNKPMSSSELYHGISKIKNIEDKDLQIAAYRKLDEFFENPHKYGLSEETLDSIDYIYGLDRVLAGKQKPYGQVEKYLTELSKKNPQKAQEMLDILENTKPEQKSLYQSIRNKFFKPKSQVSLAEERDLLMDKEIAPIKEYIEDTADPKTASRIYETRYLSKLSPAAREIAAKIDKDFGVKVFMSNTNNPESLQLIYNELLEWKKAGKQEAKFPKVIDFTSIDSRYVKSPDAVAYQYSAQRKIGFKENSPDAILYALRHEMMHENDLYPDFEFGSFNGENSEFIIRNKKYYDEIKAGLEANGISTGHTDYAYTNRLEFLAVAAEGDFSAYSDEFKDVLVKLGMPKWVLKMENKQKIGTKTQVYDHPDYSGKYTPLQNARISASARNMYIEAVNSIEQVKREYLGIFTSVQDAQFMSRVKDMEKIFEKHYRRLESFDKQIAKAQKSMNLSPEEIAAGKKPRTQEQVNAEIERLQTLKAQALDDLQKIRDDIQDTIGARMVLDDCSEEATDRLVYDLINAIDRGEIEILSLENYCGDGLKPYFSSKQIKKIRQHCRAQGYDPVITSVVNKSNTANMDYEAFFNSKGALKASGYTTAQMNIKHKNGAVSELQIRGKAINELAESEHIIYDLREGKDLINGNPEKAAILGDLPEIIKNIYKDKDNPQQKLLSQYLTECYAYARKTELKEPVKKPVLPAGLDKQLDIDNIIRIHHELGQIK